MSEFIKNPENQNLKFKHELRVYSNKGSYLMRPASLFHDNSSIHSSFKRVEEEPQSALLNERGSQYKDNFNNSMLKLIATGDERVVDHSPIKAVIIRN